MIGTVADVRFDLTGYDGGIAAPVQHYVCPICGAVLDSDDDFVLMDADGDPSKTADVAGCSRCLRMVRAERMEMPWS